MTSYGTPPASLRALVLSDMQMYFHKGMGPATPVNVAKRFVRAWIDVDFRILFYARLMRWMLFHRLKPAAILLSYRVKSRYLCDISPWTEIGPRCRLMHASSIVLGPGVRVGANCVIFNGVTMGKARPQRPGGMPSVGDNCILGTGAKILGEVHVGDDMIVGANVVVRETLEHGNAYYAKLREDRLVRYIGAAAA